MPVQLRPATVDFSMLAKLPELYQQGRQYARQAQLRNQFAGGLPTDASGNTDWAKAASIISQYDPVAGVKLGADMSNNNLDVARFEEAQRHNQAIEQNYAQGKQALVNVPDENGVLQPKIWDKSTGEFSDPPGEGRRYRQLNPGDVTKLTDEGNKFSAIKDYANSFQDSYGGYNLGGVVDYGEFAGKMARQGAGTENSKAAAEWWQGYNRNKNVVRKELYGTALTPQEQIQFEKADITPGMDPEIIKHNLAIQKTIIERGIKKKTAALSAAGFNPDVINQAYGIDTSTLQDNPIPSPAGAAKQPTAAQQQLYEQHKNEPGFIEEWNKRFGQ